MKKSQFVFRMAVVVTLLALLSSCSSNRLVSRQEIRNLDLVKVGAPDPQLNQAVHQPRAEKVAVEQQVPVGVEPEEIAVQESATTEMNTVSSATAKGSRMTEMVVKRAQHSRVAAKAVQSAAGAILSGQNVSKTKDLFNTQSDLKKKEVKHSDFDLLRLILYILVVLLVIALLQWILPGYLVYIIVLVLLIALLLYFLGAL